MTQAQWHRITGKNPSYINPDGTSGASNITLVHPVESVSWRHCNLWLTRLNLRLPSETECEYSTRAGTSSVWWTGNDPLELDGAANLADSSLKTEAAKDGVDFDGRLDDGYSAHAPVGSFLPNAFGLHDVIGNVLEWCQDIYVPADDEPSSNASGQSGLRVFRGGGWGSLPQQSRSAYSNGATSSVTYHALGVRPACSL